MTDVRKLTVDLNQTGNAVDKLGKFGLAINGVKEALNILVGAFQTAKTVLYDFTADMARAADEAAKAGRRTGLTAEGFQELTFAANIAGAEMGDVEKGMQRLSKNLNDAAVKGVGPLKDQFDALGLNVEDFIGLSTEEQFAKIADITAGLTTEQQKLAFAQDTLGRGGRKLLPVLNEGADGLAALREEARELGIFSNEGALAAEEFADAQLRFEKAIEGVKIIIAQELIPVVTEIIDWAREWIVTNREVIKEDLRDWIQKATESGRQLAPAIIAIADALSKMIPYVIEGIGEFGTFYNQIVDLDEELTANFGPAWEAVKTVLFAVLNPLGTTRDIIVELVKFIGQAVIGLAEFDGVLGDIARKALEVGGFLGVDTTKRVSQRGLTGVKQVQEAKGPGGGGVNATKKGAELRSIKAEQDSKRLLALASNANLSPEARLKAATLGAAATARESLAAQAVENALALGKQFEKDLAIADLDRQRKNFKNARKKGKKGKKKEEEVSDEELLKLINQAAESGESLTGLIGNRKVPGGVPPVITVTVNNFKQDIGVAVENNISGVPGTSAEEIASITTERTRDMMAEEFERLKDTLTPTQEI